ncbi:Pyruvate kinase [Eumeta japonica]|uniref:Pyruvate kinase n=1 Tax=Eumeta variegata TaxID=151549 RepID=A0A4C1YGR7_EUMVA|nr:Pyruvate kinase [Eumeta japonica]
MSLPWHIPLEGLSKSKGKGDGVQPTALKHYSNLCVHDNPCEELQMGLMCDIGMHNKEPVMIQRLIAAGMTIARLAIRDLEPEVCSQLVQSVREAVYSYSVDLKFIYPLAVVVDIQNPQIVTGELKGGPDATVELLENEIIRLTTGTGWSRCGTAERLYVGWENLTKLHQGDLIFIDSLTPGIVTLVVSEVGEISVECVVSTGGTIGSKMTVRLSQVPLEVDSVPSSACSDGLQQSLQHIEGQIAWAVGSDVDALLIANVQTAQDIRHVRSILTSKGKENVLTLASIDTVLGIDNIQDIIDEANGIYLDRTLLSTDLPVEKVFIAQKLIMAKCMEKGKPCICKAVINEQVPTLCMTDIANLVLDGADVLSFEFYFDSSVKKLAPSYEPLRMAEQCLIAAGIVCRQAERILWQPQMYGNLELTQTPLEEPTKAICISAVELAMRSRASVIICLTNSGRTAKLLAQVRPTRPVVAVTRLCHTARQLRFWRGVRSLHYFDEPSKDWSKEIDCRIQSAVDYCKIKRILRTGDAYIVLNGSRRGVGYCDSVRLLYASSLDVVPVT